MELHEKAAQVLESCEKHLRELMAEAAQLGDYNAVAWITSCARGVGAIASQNYPENRSTNSISQEDSLPTTATATALPSRNNSNRRKYPIFARRGDELTKIGWSKSQKREYEHRAPYQIIQPMVESLTKAGSRGKRFGADQFLPLLTADGTSVPDYQAYAVFAWLKHAGLIKQHGRGSYSVQNAAQFPEAVQNAWNGLPQDRVERD